ncbi:hypothetical protein BG003_002505 [Podila horticola]|nr:hypothetical protein BG003_002505 [Podila horticola]
MSTIHSDNSQDDDESAESRAHTPTTAVAATTTTTLPRGSMSESRNNESAGLYLQRPLTAAQRRIMAQRAYLKKFMCIVATMPVLATLAVYNKIEVVMWWVIVVPLVGIVVALIWRRKLGQKLQRLDEENSQLSLPLDRSATRVPQTRNPEEEGEVSPPPDYQASIITPPAYIVAPRKVPSYRSLENLFAFARTRSQRLVQAAAAAAANANDAVQDAAAATAGADSQPLSGEIRQHVQGDSTVEALPEMREVGSGFSESTLLVLDTISHAGDLEDPQRSSEGLENVEGLVVRCKEIYHEGYGQDEVVVIDVHQTTATGSGSSSSPSSRQSSSMTGKGSLQDDLKGKAPSRE